MRSADRFRCRSSPPLPDPSVGRWLALGFTSEVLLDVSIEPARLHDVASRLTTDPGVRFVADTLHGSSLLCELPPAEPAASRRLEGGARPSRRRRAVAAGD